MPTLNQNLQIYDAFRKYAQHEDGLINYRVTWMLSIHGFLYASYAFTIQKKLEIVEKISSGLHKNEKFIDHMHLDRYKYLLFSLLEIEVFLVVISLVGFAISGYAWRSIRAAKLSVQSVTAIFDNQYGVLVNDEGIRINNIGDVQPFLVPSIAGGGNRYSSSVGVSASVTIPIVLMASWACGLIFSAISIYSIYFSDFQIYYSVKIWFLNLISMC